MSEPPPLDSPLRFLLSAIRFANTVDRLERKGQDTGKVNEGEGGNELFQSIDVEAGPTKDRSGRERGSGPATNNKRQKRDEKYGFGGKKRFSKSSDAASSGDLKGFSAAKMKGKSKRLGKSRRTGGAR